MADEQGTLRTAVRAPGKAALDTARLPVLLTLLAILFASAAWYSHQHWVVERHERLVAERSAAHAATLATRIHEAAEQLQVSVHATLAEFSPDARRTRTAAQRSQLEAELRERRPDAERVLVLSPDDPRFELDRDFTALALAEKVFHQRPTGPEMLRRDDGWQLAVAVPIPPTVGEALSAAVLYLSADALALPSDDIQGELRLSQAFPGVRAQHFHTVGPVNARYQINLPLNVPHWQLEFSPGVGLTAQRGVLVGQVMRGISAVLAALALIGAIALKLHTWVQDYRARRRRERQLRETDAQRYQQALSLLDQFHGETDPLDAETDGLAANLPFEEPAAPVPTVAAPARIDVLFREYDIRGDADQLLSDEMVTAIGMAIGTEVLASGDRAVVVGRDGRLSSPRLLEALTDGVLATGCDLIDLGLVPTPVMNFAALTGHATRSGIMITASHNPPGDNGFKIVIAGEVLSGARIRALYQRILAEDFVEGQGILSHEQVEESYLQRMLADVSPSRLRVVLDCANGVAGPLACELLSRLGCEVTPLYCEPDGHFPNHAPDPTREDNLADLKLVVRSQGADLGIALDGDGDRMVAVTSEGRVVWPDELMMIFARDILTRQPGANIVFDVKCSYRLPQLISAYGGVPLMRRTGHSHIRNAVAEAKAPLGGEYSGHLFFPDRWFGFDDGLYAAARLIEVITLREQPLSDIVATLPASVASPEVLVAVAEEDKFRIIEQLLAGDHFEEAEIDTTDGLRVQWPFGWGLVRASNTAAQLTLRFEADSRAHLEDIRERFRAALARLDPGPEISF